MKNFKIFIAVIIIVLLPIAMFAVENYTAKKTKTAPKIGKGVDKIWSQVTMVPVNKTVVFRDRIIEPNPKPEDFNVSFGMTWDNKGLYILVKFVDDKFIREIYKDDPISDWSRDDNISMLFNKNHEFDAGEPPMEFGCIVTYTTEAKATIKLGVPKDAVKVGWTVEGNTYWGEFFIAWKSFAKPLKAGDKFPFEFRARDDDQAPDRKQDYPQSFFQWSTDQLSVEGSGIGMGVITLGTEEIK